MRHRCDSYLLDLWVEDLSRALLKALHVHSTAETEVKVLVQFELTVCQNASIMVYYDKNEKINGFMSHKSKNKIINIFFFFTFLLTFFKKAHRNAVFTKTCNATLFHIISSYHLTAPGSPTFRLLSVKRLTWPLTLSLSHTTTSVGFSPSCHQSLCATTNRQTTASSLRQQASQILNDTKQNSTQVFIL